MSIWIAFNREKKIIAKEKDIDKLNKVIKRATQGYRDSALKYISIFLVPEKIKI